MPELEERIGVLFDRALNGELGLVAEELGGLHVGVSSWFPFDKTNYKNTICLLEAIARSVVPHDVAFEVLYEHGKKPFVRVLGAQYVKDSDSIIWRVRPPTPGPCGVPGTSEDAGFGLTPHSGSELGRVVTAEEGLPNDALRGPVQDTPSSEVR
jgi:hypothetical protein